MALSETAHISLGVAALGVLAFIFGVIAENKKPENGVPIRGKAVIICKYPHDPTIALGSLSVIFIFLSTVLGMVSVYYPYKGKSIPAAYLFRSASLLVFFTIALSVSVLAAAMMMWVTITEGLHISRNVHHNLNYQCPTGKTGLFGGAAFLALDAALFWLVCQMLTLNARADYEEEEDTKGDYGHVVAEDYDGNQAGQQRSKV